MRRNKCRRRIGHLGLSGHFDDFLKFHLDEFVYSLNNDVLQHVVENSIEWEVNETNQSLMNSTERITRNLFSIGYVSIEWSRSFKILFDSLEDISVETKGQIEWAIRIEKKRKKTRSYLREKNEGIRKIKIRKFCKETAVGSKNSPNFPYSDKLIVQIYFEMKTFFLWINHSNPTDYCELFQNVCQIIQTEVF